MYWVIAVETGCAVHWSSKLLFSPLVVLCLVASRPTNKQHVDLLERGAVLKRRMFGSQVRDPCGAGGQPTKCSFMVLQVLTACLLVSSLQKYVTCQNVNGGYRCEIKNCRFRLQEDNSAGSLETPPIKTIVCLCMYS